MERKWWKVGCLFTALLSGYYLYTGGKLLIFYQDRRQGIYILFFGMLTVALYAWSVKKAFETTLYERDICKCWEKEKQEIVLGTASFALWSVGVSLYANRYQSLRIMIFKAGIIFCTAAAAILYCLFLFDGSETETEGKFKEQFQKRKEMLLARGYLKLDASAEQAAEMYISERSAFLKDCSAIAVIAAGCLTIPSQHLIGKVLILVTAVVLVVGIFYFVRTARKGKEIRSLMQQGKNASVVGACLLSYTEGKGLRRKQTFDIPYYTVSALFHQEAYEEVLDFLSSFYPLPEQGGEFAEYEAVSSYLLDERERFSDATEKLQLCIQKASVRSGKNLKQTYEICRHLQALQYEDVWRWLQKPDASTGKRRDYAEVLERKIKGH